MATETLHDTVEIGDPPAVARRATADSSVERRQARVPSHPALRPQSPAPTYIGIVVTAAGFVLLAVAWGGVAGQSDVAFQIPYLVSGGLFGLGLIMVGLLIVNVATKRRDAALREQQIQLLAAALRALQDSDDGER